ncbi:hypothetical protein [Tolypothrix sp. VBCCA 56010]|uniref:hypothetical protein n=1 Tax=Tolypothrix sp. VBCCA 56010 TaxID=3137731 RepID=UPI003D7CE9AF
MATDNEVQAIYQAIDNLNKRIDQLSNQGALEQRVSTLEKDMKNVGVFLTRYVEPVLKVLTKFIPFKSTL